MGYNIRMYMMICYHSNKSKHYKPYELNNDTLHAMSKVLYFLASPCMNEYIVLTIWGTKIIVLAEFVLSF